jgi:hypothetical protein
LKRLLNSPAANWKSHCIPIPQDSQRHQDNGHTRRSQKESVIVEELLGKVVVIDVESPFVFVGKLVEVREKSLVLKQADVHDLRDSTTTREIYVRDARVHGIQANRKTVYVRIDQIVSVSHLDDVIP